MDGGISCIMSLLSLVYCQNLVPERFFFFLSPALLGEGWISHVSTLFAITEVMM